MFDVPYIIMYNVPALANCGPILSISLASCLLPFFHVRVPTYLVLAYYA